MSYASDDPEGYEDHVVVPAILQWLCAQAGIDETTDNADVLRDIATGIASRSEVLGAILFECDGWEMLDDSRYFERKIP